MMMVAMMILITVEVVILMKKSNIRLPKAFLAMMNLHIQ